MRHVSNRYSANSLVDNLEYSIDNHSLNIGEILNFDSTNIFLPRAVADDYRDSLSDTSAPLGSLAPGGSATGSIEESGDRDIFAISLQAGQNYVFTLNRAASAGLSDPVLRLLGSSGSVIATNDDFGGSLNSRISYTASSSGTFYLDARGYGSNTGSYTLASTGTPPAATDDYRDSVTDLSAPLGALVAGTASSGRIETSGDKDLFSFTVAAGETYVFNLSNASGSGSLADPLLRLLDANGGQIAINDDFGGGRNSQITYTAAASGTVYLEAGGYQTGTGAYTLAGLVDGGPPTGGGFDVVINYSGDAQYQTYFDQAAARWEEAITGDLPDFVSATFGTIDDLLIDASAVAIDGSGGILGQAGPDTFRSGSNLPAHGIMEFDSADLAGMAADGSLLGVILHEMGHVLGIGTLWDTLGLESNYRYTGENALAEYRTLSGDANATYVPVEDSGGPGTAGGHWEEDVFQNELMTGYASGNMAMSRMTIASLEDMGYQVNLDAADAYTLPSNLNGMNSLQTPDIIYGIV